MIDILIHFILPASILLGVLIVVHEFGHFSMAKLLRIKVLKFCVGFGPKLIAKKIGDTIYQLSIIPLGGYVKLFGENPEEEIKDEEKPYSFSHRRIRDRLLIVCAGPIANIIFAYLLLSTIYLFGVPTLLPEVGKLTKDYPASKAGIQPGDLIVSIDEKTVVQWEELSKIIEASKGNKLKIKIKRGQKILTFYLYPKLTSTVNIFGQKKLSYKIGIEPSWRYVTKRYLPWVAFWKGLKQTAYWIKLTVVSIFKLIERAIPAKSLGGPILIAQMAGKVVQAGLVSFLSFMAIISINLGILNLLPIPILDGGHVLFLSIEFIRGKPLSVKKMEIAQQIGLFILIMIMVLVFYNDITRLIMQ